jgi:uncharacterized membrane protein YkvA (DUF1232 family)
VNALATLKQRARLLRSEAFALYLAARHPGTPWYAKALAGGVAAYAFSPVDLIPDFIPVVGYLDDLILVPAGIALAVRLVPAAVLAECRQRSAAAFADGTPVSGSAAAVIVSVWLALAAVCAVGAFDILAKR